MLRNFILAFKVQPSTDHLQMKGPTSAKCKTQLLPEPLTTETKSQPIRHHLLTMAGILGESNKP